MSDLGSREFWPVVEYDKDGNALGQGGYRLAILRGRVPGAGVIRQIGRNPDVDDVREDCWESGGTYVFPAAAGIQMRVISTSAQDGVAGTGAQTVDIVYLDANGVETELNVTMNGTTQVLTVPTNIRRVNDFHIKTAGSTKLAVGTISLTNVAGTVTYATIQPNNGRSRQAVFTVPAGKTAFIDELIISGNSTGGPSDYLEGYFRATCDYTGAVLDGIFNFKAGWITSNSASTQTLSNPIIVPALCDMKMSVQSRAGSSNVIAVCGFAGWYENA